MGLIKQFIGLILFLSLMKAIIFPTVEFVYSEDEQFEEELIPSHSEFDDYLFSDEEEDEDLENENDDLKESK